MGSIDTFDYVIIGGGTAGCVLANRLSENHSVRVLLLEAGRDMPPGRESRSIRDPFPSSYGDSKNFWPDLVAEVGADPGDGRPRFSRVFVQGRLMGGSSSIMGMLAMRGVPEDYEEWAALGADGWRWDDVLPFFNRLEADQDFGGPLHGKDGPIPIRRYSRDQWPPFARAMGEAMENLGYPYRPDYNAQFEDCVSSVPMNNWPNRRVSTASAYLDDTTRRRPNLKILANTTADRLVLEGTRTVGVFADGLEGRRRFNGRETIICCGAIHSPALLMRSGVGPAESLRSVGVSAVIDRRGVGQNLLNHAMVNLAVHLPSRSAQPRAMRSWGCSVLRYSSNHPGGAPGDMQIAPTNKSAWHPLGRRIGAVGICLYKPYSAGEVTLRAPDRHIEPSVKFNILSDSRDFDRLVDAVQLAFSVLASAGVAKVRNEVFLPSGGLVNELNRPSPRNWIKSVVISKLFALPGGARRRLLGDTILESHLYAADRQACADLVLKAAAPVHHVCGTCKIGSAHDPLAVVDPRLRVHGIAGLRVVDASIMPTIVRGNTHLPVIMIGEKAAEMIRSDGKDDPRSV